MANFTEDLHSFRPQFPFLEIDPNNAQINQLTEINQTIQENSNFNLQSNFLPISNDHIIFNHQAPEFTMALAGSFPPNSHQINNNVMAVSLRTTGNDQSEVFGSKKRKAIEVSSECSSLNSSPHISVGGIIRKNSSRRGKKVKSHEEKPKEVVHVRARRGQATDSHSLAERVRRGRINERLRCLQDIVPGCYKSMGMAVMLDEIINYVQSLQNQVEFLSMKLTAASTFYDFNAEADVIDAMQRAKAEEAKELERVMRERCGGHPSFHSSSAWTL